MNVGRWIDARNPDLSFHLFDHVTAYRNRLLYRD